MNGFGVVSERNRGPSGFDFGNGPNPYGGGTGRNTQVGFPSRRTHGSGGTPPPTPYYVDPAQAQSDPRGAQGQLTRAQWQLFVDRYRPLENEAKNLALRDYTPELQSAGDVTNRLFDNAADIAARQRSRYGLAQSAQAQAASQRKLGLARARAVSGVKNNLSRLEDESRLQNLTTLIGIGKGVSGQAGDDISSAASMATQRDLAGKQAKAQKKAALTQTVGSIAGSVITGLILGF